jgi:cell division septation protein DedD
MSAGTHVQDPNGAEAQAASGAGEREPASISQLAEDHEKFEARLQLLENIVLHAGNYRPAANGNNSLDPVVRTSPAASAGSLASRPIEPVVIMQPMEEMPAPGKPRASMAVTPAAEEQPVMAQLPAPPRPAGNTGNWAINLGSYSSRKIADRMLEKYHRQDIAAELVTAVVNNRTMYRLRIPGFQTRQTAVAHAESLQQRLGVADVWIKKM